LSSGQRSSVFKSPSHLTCRCILQNFQHPEVFINQMQYKMTIIPFSEPTYVALVVIPNPSLISIARPTIVNVDEPSCSGSSQCRNTRNISFISGQQQSLSPFCTLQDAIRKCSFSISKMRHLPLMGACHKADAFLISAAFVQEDENIGLYIYSPVSYFALMYTRPRKSSL
jgi:hypothetical protein